MYLMHDSMTLSWFRVTIFAQSGSCGRILLGQILIVGCCVEDLEAFAMRRDLLVVGLPLIVLSI